MERPTFKKVSASFDHMNPKEIMSKLAANPEYQAWIAAHPKDILAHIFLEPDNVQVGYFDAEKNLMTTFVVADELKIIPDQEILRGDGVIDPLDIDEVTQTPESAKAAADTIRKEHYTAQSVLKSLIILQKLEGICVYNITYFTAAFKTINIKVNAIDGSIIHHSLASLVDFDKNKPNPA